MAEQKKYHRFITEIDMKDVDRVKQLVLASRNVVITCDVSPDGDALVSSCDLFFVFISIG